VASDTYMCTYDVMLRMHVEVSVGGTQQKIHKSWRMASLLSLMPTMPTTANFKNLIQYIIVLINVPLRLVGGKRCSMEPGSTGLTVSGVPKL
jgi:hypothetical protein